MFCIFLICYFFRYAFEWLSDIPPKPFCFTQRYQEVKEVLLETFFGPPQVGVYSPSVQNTLYLMAKAVLNKYCIFFLQNFSIVITNYTTLLDHGFLMLQVPGCYITSSSNAESSLFTSELDS